MENSIAAPIIFYLIFIVCLETFNYFIRIPDYRYPDIRRYLVRINC